MTSLVFPLLAFLYASVEQAVRSLLPLQTPAACIRAAFSEAMDADLLPRFCLFNLQGAPPVFWQSVLYYSQGLIVLKSVIRFDFLAKLGFFAGLRTALYFPNNDAVSTAYSTGLFEAGFDAQT
jgi:hypothetical protein